jgi:hypothetical protein
MIANVLARKYSADSVSMSCDLPPIRGAEAHDAHASAFRHGSRLSYFGIDREYCWYAGAPGVEHVQLECPACTGACKRELQAGFKDIWICSSDSSLSLLQEREGNYGRLRRKPRGDLPLVSHLRGRPRRHLFPLPAPTTLLALG